MIIAERAPRLPFRPGLDGEWIRAERTAFLLYELLKFLAG
jgi:hypothetical protein